MDDASWKVLRRLRNILGADLAKFPYLQEISGGRLAYLMPLTFGRWRINVMDAVDIYGVTDSF